LTNADNLTTLAPPLLQADAPASKKAGKAAAAAGDAPKVEEVVRLGPAVREGEDVFAVAHIFASFNDTFVCVSRATDASARSPHVRSRSRARPPAGSLDARALPLTPPRSHFPRATPHLRRRPPPPHFAGT